MWVIDNHGTSKSITVLGGYVGVIPECASLLKPLILVFFSQMFRHEPDLEPGSHNYMTLPERGDIE